MPTQIADTDIQAETAYKRKRPTLTLNKMTLRTKKQQQISSEEDYKTFVANETKSLLLRITTITI